MRSLYWLSGLATLALVGCMGEVSGFGLGDPDVPPINPDPPEVAIGVVTEPRHGEVVEGNPGSVRLRVAGIYEDGPRPLAVQILENPEDLASWRTIATTTARPSDGGAYRFSVDVQPVSSAAESARWPRGGVLRLRVVDDLGRALSLDEDEPADTTLALVSPLDVPDGWTYLREKPTGSAAGTSAYYVAIDAPTTLTAFRQRYGFPGNEVTALYYNRGDLHIGRGMHCRAIAAGGVACYVQNYGEFGGSQRQALSLTLAGDAPFATVAMVYTPPHDAPNAVKFMVYGANGALLDEAQLDTRGDNISVPQNCLNCHGGRSSFNAATNTVRGAHFLPFDPAAFEYATAPQFTLAAQEDELRQLNRLIAETSQTAAARQVIDGMFPAGNAPFDPRFVPAAWSAAPRDARVYREVIAPYCRGCHVTFDRASEIGTFSTPAEVKAQAASIIARVCGAGPTGGMPAAEATAQDFFASPARALLLAWLDAPGACAPR